MATGGIPWKGESVSRQRYFVTGHKGLEQVLCAELRAPEIGATEVRPGSSGAWFSGDRDVGYRACLWLRSGIRVLEEIARGPAVGAEELYEWGRALDWNAWLDVKQTFSVEARVWDSEITHSKYAALRIKDALCDFFRKRCGSRPDVDTERADLPLFLYVYRDEAILYRDLAGTTLHKRGYRDALHKSSLNEALAAGILLQAGYDGRVAFADPMCGAGTFAIEAALIAARRAPGLARKSFPFETWPDFDRKRWKDCRGRAYGAARYEVTAPIMANDRHAGALSLAAKDAAEAGVGEYLRCSESEVGDFLPEVQPNLVCVNPPWGKRLDGPDVADAWRGLGRFLRERCPGASASVLTGNRDLVRELGIPPAEMLTLRTGKVECWIVRLRMTSCMPTA